MTPPGDALIAVRRARQEVNGGRGTAEWRDYGSAGHRREVASGFAQQLRRAGRLIPRSAARSILGAAALAD
jgi:hypothetical protein